MSITEIEQLIGLLSKLPSFGPRSARRAVLYLMTKKESHFIPLIATMQQVAEHVQTCPVCGNLDTQSPCSICTNPERHAEQICVVEDVADLWALERAGAFKGTYHVLGGVLSALDGIGPEELKINELIQRITDTHVTEVILALPTTVEGQTTAHYITDKLLPLQVQISALSRGVPIGGELDYLDDGTLQMAFKARRTV